MELEKAPRSCTHGTEAFLKTFTDGHDKLPVGGVLINMQTLLRNLLSENIDGPHAIKMLEKEVQYIVSILTPTLKRNTGQHKPYILFYLFDYYTMLSGWQLRPNTGQREKMARLVRLLLVQKERYFKNGQVGNVNGIPIYAHCRTASGNTPHQYLFNIIQDISASRSLCMMSHQVVDWHLYILLREFALVNCFTGNVITPKEMSEKAFSDRYMDLPFRPGTHRLLGDKPLVKPLLTPKQKMELLELSEKDDWKHKSAEYISKKIYDLYRV